MKALAALTFSLWLGAAGAAESDRVDVDIKAHDAHVAQLRRDFEKTPPVPGNKEWVKAKLQHMVDVEQYLRRLSATSMTLGYDEAELIEFNQRVSALTFSVDLQNTKDLKALLKIYPWFTIGEFGEMADSNAFLIVQHADHDTEFQRQMLAVLEPMAAKGETNPKLFAYLFDRVAVSFGKPADRKLQRYGTQGRCTGPGKWEPFPVEHPEKLEERRAQLGLEPEAEYQKWFANVCRESIEETLRRADEAANKTKS